MYRGIDPLAFVLVLVISEIIDGGWLGRTVAIGALLLLLANIAALLYGLYWFVSHLQWVS